MEMTQQSDTYPFWIRLEMTIFKRTAQLGIAFKIHYICFVQNFTVERVDQRK